MRKRRIYRGVGFRYPDPVHRPASRRFARCVHFAGSHTFRGSAFVLVVSAAMAPLPACEDARTTPSVGPDCAHLIDAARRAARCDPALTRLVHNLEADPDVARCRTAARVLLAGPPPTGGGIRSVFEPEPQPGSGPLTEEERIALQRLPFPARVLIRPDRPHAPGIPTTSARVGGLLLDEEEPGLLSRYVPPGEQTLELRYAGAAQSYCVSLDPCEVLELTAHGAKLSVHARARPGPCAPETGETAGTGTG